MPVQSYNVPILPPDLRHEEFILHVADTLDYLEKISADIFGRITQRVQENKDKLNSINKRVDLAQAKIERIKGSRKAIRVFSSAKYPAPQELEPYVSLFQYGNSVSELQEVKRQYHHVATRHRPTDERSVKEKLQFYNVQISGKSSNKEADRGEGLGKLPKNLKSVSSLLLFNTAENPYKKYVMLDPLSGAVTKTRTTMEEEDESLGEAPSTITNREQMERGTAENFLYMPGLGEVPEIDVPAYLPDLPGVADDLMYR